MNDTRVRHLEIAANAVYSPCEVAWLLKINKNIVYQMVKEKKIKSCRIGIKQIKPPIRILGSDLLEYIKNLPEYT